MSIRFACLTSKDSHEPLESIARIRQCETNDVIWIEFHAITISRERHTWLCTNRTQWSTRPNFFSDKDPVTRQYDFATTGVAFARVIEFCRAGLIFSTNRLGLLIKLEKPIHQGLAVWFINPIHRMLRVFSRVTANLLVSEWRIELLVPRIIGRDKRVSSLLLVIQGFDLTKPCDLLAVFRCAPCKRKNKPITFLDLPSVWQSLEILVALSTVVIVDGFGFLNAEKHGHTPATLA